MDADLLEAADFALGWEHLKHPSETAYPKVRAINSTAEWLPVREEARLLKEYEYIACRKESGTFLFLADGYVQFPQDSTETLVGGYPCNGDDPQSTLPISALETALFRGLLLQETLMIHALAFEYQGQGLLVLGASGAGKTTLALAALAAGAKIVSDDRVALRREGDKLRAYSMRPFFHIRSSTLQTMNSSVLPAYLSELHGNPTDVILRRETAPEAFIDGTTIDGAMILPEPQSDRPERSRVKVASKAETLGAAIASSLPFLFTLSTRELGANPTQLCLQLLGAVDNLHLTSGANLMAAPGEEFTAINREIENITNWNRNAKP